jgi:hypothetical protein
MYAMNHKITIGKYALRMVDSITVSKSVENLADTATIVIPGAHANRALKVEDKVKVGDAVAISLGYDGKLEAAFKGYLSSVSTDDGAIRLECEDALYLFKKPVEDVEHKDISLNDLLSKLAAEVNGANKRAGTPTSYKVACDYDFKYEKFVFRKATAFDVLKKVQDETRANIYFDGETLHVHPQYSEVVGGAPVVFDFARNIEKSELKYMLAKDRKVEVEVNATMADGTTKKITYGVTGGTKKTVNLSTTDEDSMKKRAEQEYNLFAYDGYEGNFTAWLTPYVAPTCKVSLRDAGYPHKNGDYYVVAVETKLSSAGGERVVTIGKRIG